MGFWSCFVCSAGGKSFERGCELVTDEQFASLIATIERIGLNLGAGMYFMIGILTILVFFAGLAAGRGR